MNVSREDILEAMRKGPVVSKGSVHLCVECDHREAIGVQDLMLHEPTPTGWIVVANLTGTRCRHCGAETFDAPSLYAVRAARMAAENAPDFETTVTTVGKMPATYFKADLVRALKLEKGQRLRWRPLGPGRAEVTVLGPE